MHICKTVVVLTLSVCEGQSLAKTTEDPLLDAIEKMFKGFVDGTTTSPSSDHSDGENSFFDGINLDLFTQRPSTTLDAVASSPAPSTSNSFGGLTIDPTEAVATPGLSIVTKQEILEDYTSLLVAILIVLILILAILVLQLVLPKCMTGKRSEAADDLEENAGTVSSCRA
ncbi:hypothetical protein FOL47_006284 [Perkinsus chesapeaki]|uniref:Uncharacterized protein n=1 Tax=Perkinsus chesapeaki TaxID=330153 RepID=A0A7J6MYV3_PERCH|nr:hypothetical protein FOL47_006284 [Perkinsus chesapeaki]